MAKGRFGGDTYKPKQLGPEPASASIVPPVESVAPPPPIETSAAVAPPAPTPAPDPSVAALRAVKVPFSSRISYAADLQLKALAKEGSSQTDLLAEALNLLFKERGLDEVA